MIKTLSINLGGRVFQINEDAYQELSNYLDHLNAFYNNTEGKDEIISDIESRFAEIFTEKVIDKGRSVVALHDTMEVIEMMGKPEDFDVENEGEPQKKEAKQDSNFFNVQTGKRFYRDSENGVVSGVCSGIASYFGVSDPVWIRLLFILLFFAGGSSFLIYFILWIAIPEAKTNTQKLEMRGEQINLENLEKSVRTELNKAGNNISNFVSGDKNNSGLSKIVNFVGTIFLGIFNAIFWIGKNFLYFLAGILLITLFITFISLLFSGFAVIPELTKHFFDNSAIGVIGIIGAIMFVLGPLLLLILGLVKICSSKVQIGRPAVFSILGTTLIGLILVSICALSVRKSFIASQSEIKNTELFIGANKQLTLNANEMEEKEIKVNIFGSNLFQNIDGKGLEIRNVKLEILPTYDTVFSLKTKSFSQGNNNIMAEKNAKAINYALDIKNDMINFNPYFYSGTTTKWRNQQVRYKLSMPEGATIVLGKNIKDILSDDTWEKMDYQTIEAGSTWKMVNGKLISLDTFKNHQSEFLNYSNMKSLDFEDFDELEFAGNFDVEIKAGNKYQVLVPNDFEANGEISQNGSRLFLETNSKDFLKKNTNLVKVVIVSPSINVIKLVGATIANMSGFGTGDLEVVAIGAATFNANFNIDDLDLNLTGGSSSRLIGSCNNLNLTCIGASSFKGIDFEIEDAEIEIVGASNAKLNVVNSLNGNVTGASSVFYKGNPDKDLEINGASDVSSIN